MNALERRSLWPLEAGFWPLDALSQTTQVCFSSKPNAWTSRQAREREGSGRGLRTQSLSREAFAFPPRWRADAQECHTPSVVFGPDASGRKMQNPWL